MKVPVPDNQQVIEAFSPHAPQEPFADRVGLWSAVGRLQDFNGACPCNSCELVAVLAVPIANQEMWGQAIGCRFPKLSRHPGVGRMGCDATINNSSRTEFYNEEGVDLPEEQVDNWLKVTCPDMLGVILEES